MIFSLDQIKSTFTQSHWWPFAYYQ